MKLDDHSSLWSMYMEIYQLNPPYLINVYRETIPNFISSITNTCYFNLTTQHEPNQLVASPFSLKSYKTNGYLWSEPPKNNSQLETTYKTTMTGLAMYLKDSEDALLQLVREHDGRKKIFFIQQEAKKFTQNVNLPNLDKRAHEPTAKFAKRAKQKACHQAQDFLEKQWEDKALHGKYPKRVKDADSESHQTNQWLKSSGLKAEREGLIIAAQDQNLATRSYHARIIMDNNNPMCRMCNKYEETVDHIVSGCPKPAQTEYTPEIVTESEDVTILWNIQINTDWGIAAYKPNIVIIDHKTMTCKLIDMAVPSDRNTSVKVIENFQSTKT